MNFREMQNNISRLYADPDASVADYLSCTQALKCSPREEIPSYMQNVRAAFLSSFTVQGLSEVMMTRAIFHNVWLETYNTPYNQFSQEILNPDSALYSFNPTIAYLIVDAKDFLNEEHLNQLLGVFCSLSAAKIVVFDFITPFDHSFSHQQIEVFNKSLKNVENKYPQMVIFDFSSFLERLGKEKYWYTKYKELGDLRLSPDAFISLSEALLRYAIDLSGAAKKCLVVDLDDTLWEGIVGEEGIQGVAPRKDLQKYLLELSRTGVILAINSKNNIKDAFEVIDNHPDMILRKNNFAAWRINWQDKVRNIQELVSELNIGSDSIVFLDDSPFEQDLVRSCLPEVAIVPIEYIQNYSGFQKTSITEEDVRRTAMYQEERQRDEFKSSFPSVEDYLKNLDLKVRVSEARQENISRISQLTQKTNQFNVTTRRYTENEVLKLLEQGWKIMTLEVYDRFGDYGLTGVCIVEILTEAGDKIGRIDTFLLSCRVLGRGAEKAFLVSILNRLKSEHTKKLIGEYIPTKKNVPCESFFPENRFVLTRREGDSYFYEYDLNEVYQMPSFIEVL